MKEGVTDNKAEVPLERKPGLESASDKRFRLQAEALRRNLRRRRAQQLLSEDG